MRVLILALALATGCATVSRHGPASTDWDGSGGGLWTPPPGLFLAQAQANGGNDLTIGNLVVTGTSALKGVTTITGNTTPSATNTYSLGTSALRWSTLFASSWADSGGANRISAGTASTTSLYIGAIANSATNTDHVFTTTVTKTTATRIAGFCATGNTTACTQVAAIHNSGKIMEATTDSTGTPGSATITTPTGQFSIAAGASTATITSNADVVVTTSIIIPVIQTADATCTFIKSVVPSSGSFVVTVNANCTAATVVGFIVFN